MLVLRFDKYFGFAWRSWDIGVGFDIGGHVRLGKRSLRVYLHLGPMTVGLGAGVGIE